MVACINAKRRLKDSWPFFILSSSKALHTTLTFAEFKITSNFHYVLIK